MSTSPVSSPPANEPSKSIPRGPFLPLLLFMVAFLGWAVSQTMDLIRERSALGQAWSLQNAPLAQARKIRASTSSLATKTQKLADAGNSNAEIVIAHLKQQGITISPNASPVPPP